MKKSFKIVKYTLRKTVMLGWTRLGEIWFAWMKHKQFLTHCSAITSINNNKISIHDHLPLRANKLLAHKRLTSGSVNVL